MSYQDMNPNGTTAQNALLFQGRRAVVSASPLAFASLANGQTFVTLDAAGATLSRTINAPLAASTTLATFCAALAAQLNLDGTGYTWTATTSTVDGTAKLPGSAFNSAPTGTAVYEGTIVTAGTDPIVDIAVPTVTFESLLSEMSDLEGLARFPSPVWTPKQASSYNRASTAHDQADQGFTGWFKDSDGVGYIRTESINGTTEWVVMEHDGPGAVTRLWAPFFYDSYGDRTGPNIRIYLDGSTTPVIDQNLIELLTNLLWAGGYGGKPASTNTIALPAPYAQFTARAGVAHLPIPFATSCKITLTEAPFYNTISYRAYVAGTQVKTFTPADLGSSLLLSSSTSLIATTDFTGGTLTTSSSPIAAGATSSLDLPAGPNAIKHLEITLDAAAVAADPSILRSLVLTGTFDGEQTIWCPIGDFFGSSNRLNDLSTYARTAVASTGVLTCRWMMPYQKTGNITILNLGGATATITTNIRTDRWSWDSRSMHFHSSWLTDVIHAGNVPADINFISVTGKGALVGDSLTALNLTTGWWGEGDEKIYVDGDYDLRKFPSLFGTGTEDYYGWAGGVVPTRDDEFGTMLEANVQVGSIAASNSPLGFNVNTRARILDRVPFNTKMRFDMEASAGTDQRTASDLIAYSAVTHWYAMPGATDNRAGVNLAASTPITSLAQLQVQSATLAHVTGQKRIWRLGDDDAGAVSGGAGNATTVDSTGTLSLTKVGTPVYSNVRPGGGSALSLLFNGTSAYTGSDAGLLASIDWNNFDISFDAQPTAGAAPYAALCFGRYTEACFFVYVTGTSWRVQRAAVGDTITGAAGTAKIGQWQTVRLVRTGGTLTMYVNGVSVGSTESWQNPTTYFTIGAARNQLDNLDIAFVGYLDNVVILG